MRSATWGARIPERYPGYGLKRILPLEVSTFESQRYSWVVRLRPTKLNAHHNHDSRLVARGCCPAVATKIR
ncbi:hypothetical protein BGZ74_010831, partial [Mortierella antarctica]